MSLSARCRILQALQSMSGSLKVLTWPDGHPDLWIHQNGGVLPHVVGALLNKLLPPGPLDVVLQLHTQGTVIPGIGQSAINL